MGRATRAEIIVRAWRAIQYGGRPHELIVGLLSGSRGFVLISGSCHCGNITFSLGWPREPPEIPARACACSFCLKHGGVWTSNAESTLAVNVTRPALVSKYSFGTKTATFHVCSRCGVVPLVTCELDKKLYAVVNVNAFQNVDPSCLRRSAADFEAEDLESRLARRKRNWIGNVRIIEASA
jgi:hypothetical protein